MAPPVPIRRIVAALATLSVVAVSAAPVLAHDLLPSEAPTIPGLLLGWSFEPLPALGIAAATAWWLWAVRRVDSLHPANPVPRRRTIAFLAAMTTLAFALLSGIGRYDTSLFSVHMVQHVLLMLVAAPLIALSAPITLILRLSSAGTRRRRILPILNSRIVRFLTFPVTDWIVFAGVMWASHFSPLFNAALEDPIVHDLEHALFLSTAVLFWWPAAGADPAPWRMVHPVRIVHVFLQMTQNTFLAVVILNVPTVLYAHYATLVRAWGPSAIDDQRLAAGIMWLAGDIIFLTAIMILVAAWMRAEGRTTARADRQAEIDLAQIRVREQRLAERLANERDDPRA